MWILCSLCCASDASSLRLAGHESTLLGSWCGMHAAVALGSGRHVAVWGGAHGQRSHMFEPSSTVAQPKNRTPLNGLDKSDVRGTSRATAISRSAALRFRSNFHQRYVWYETSGPFGIRSRLYK